MRVCLYMLRAIINMRLWHACAMPQLSAGVSLCRFIPARCRASSHFHRIDSATVAATARPQRTRALDIY